MAMRAFNQQFFFLKNDMFIAIREKRQQLLALIFHLLAPREPLIQLFHSHWQSLQRFSKLRRKSYRRTVPVAITSLLQIGRSRLHLFPCLTDNIIVFQLRNRGRMISVEQAVKYKVHFAA
ncbi:hypothetical protein D3C73_1265520 [compost metagenome]